MQTQTLNHLGKELRFELTKPQVRELMDFLMVEFNDAKDYHYNYYFDTPKGDLSQRNITLRQRTLVKDDAIKHVFTLKIPSIEDNTYLEYHQNLSDKEMKLLVYNNHLPAGEIRDLNAIHGGFVQKTKVIRTSRVYATYKDINVFFDKISHRGHNYYEVGVKIDAMPGVKTETGLNQFHELLAEFGHTYTPAPRRSQKYQ